MSFRDQEGRFAKKDKMAWRRKKVAEGHEYCKILKGSGVASSTDKDIDSKYCNNAWKEGRRLVEWDVVLNNLKYCKKCRLRPVPITLESPKGELQKCLGGFLYVRCQNLDCGFVNFVEYGKTYHEQSSNGQGMACFVVNTKLGVAMIESLGGPSRVSNVVSTLNLKTVSDKNLKKMERRAGTVVKAVAADFNRVAAEEAFQIEMGAVACQESLEAQARMDGIIEDLGVCPLPDSSPSLMLNLHGVSEIDGWTDEEDEINIDHRNESHGYSTLTDSRRLTHKRHGRSRTLSRKSPVQAQSKLKVKLTTRYPCRTRSGMSAAVDTMWSSTLLAPIHLRHGLGG